MNRMIYKSFIMCGLLGSLLTAGPGCSDPEEKLFIRSFGADVKEILVGLSDQADVTLNRAYGEKIYVDVTNKDYEQILEVTYDTAKNNAVVLRYDPGQVSKTVKLKGLKAGKASITFQLRLGNEIKYVSKQVLEVTIKDIPVPEAGPDTGTKDMGTADKPTQEKGVKEASVTEGGSTDKGSTDKGSVDKGSADKGAAAQ